MQWGHEYARNEKTRRGYQDLYTRDVQLAREIMCSTQTLRRKRNHASYAQNPRFRFHVYNWRIISFFHLFPVPPSLEGELQPAYPAIYITLNKRFPR